MKQRRSHPIDFYAAIVGALIAAAGLAYLSCAAHGQAPKPQPLGVDTEQLAENILLHLDIVAERHPEVDRQKLVEDILFQTLTSAQQKRFKVKASDLAFVEGNR